MNQPTNQSINQPINQCINRSLGSIRSINSLLVCLRCLKIKNLQNSQPFRTGNWPQHLWVLENVLQGHLDHLIYRTWRLMVSSKLSKWAIKYICQTFAELWPVELIQGKNYPHPSHFATGHLCQSCTLSDNTFHQAPWVSTANQSVGCDCSQKTHITCICHG